MADDGLGGRDAADRREALSYQLSVISNQSEHRLGPANVWSANNIEFESVLVD